MPDEREQPVLPKYGDPYQPPTGEGEPVPDAVTDTQAGVSELSVTDAWRSGGPSFNEEPASSPAEGPEPEETPTPDVPPFSVSMASVRHGMSTMVGELEALVASYESLRAHVSDTRDTVFGQFATTTYETNAYAGGAVKEFYAQNERQMFATNTRTSVIVETAVEFARNMNPAQDRVLGQIADSIQIAGQFLAAVDRAGRSYATADRKAQFPEPPSGSLTRT